MELFSLQLYLPSSAAPLTFAAYLPGAASTNTPALPLISSPLQNIQNLINIKAHSGSGSSPLTFLLGLGQQSQNRLDQLHDNFYQLLFDPQLTNSGWGSTLYPRLKLDRNNSDLLQNIFSIHQLSDPALKSALRSSLSLRLASDKIAAADSLSSSAMQIIEAFTHSLSNVLVELKSRVPSFLDILTPKIAIDSQNLHAMVNPQLHPYSSPPASTGQLHQSERGYYRKNREILLPRPIPDERRKKSPHDLRSQTPLLFHARQFLNTLLLRIRNLFAI